MEITLDLIVFTVLAVFTLASAVLAVTTKRILRAATFLLFVLFGTAGIYFQLNYSFLGAVQLLIYAGGITVLYVFSILLTSSEGDKAEKLRGYKFVVGILATLAGLAICLFVTLRHQFLPEHFEHGELAVREIGFALMSPEKQGYLLPFEVISLLLLACIVGGILIDKKKVPERVKKRARPHSSILPYNGSPGGGAGQGARKQRNVVHEGCGKAMRSMESVQNKLLL